MSELEGKTPEEDLGTAVRQTFSEILYINQQIVNLTEDRDAKLVAIRKRIIEEGAPEEERFVARALLSASIANKGPEAIINGVGYWERLDYEVRSHAGESIAWLEPEETTVAHRLPGPDHTDIDYYLTLGILPADAQLQDEASSGYKIPVKKAVRVRFFYNLDEKLAWDMGIGDLHHFVGEPEFLDRPEILPTEDGILPHRALGLPSAVNVPLPIIGNEAVAAILTENNLADQPAVLRAAQMLTESIT